MFWITKSHQQTVSHEFNVLAHHLAVHSNERYRQCRCHELMLIGYCILQDGQHLLMGKLSLQHAVKQAGEIAVHAFVAADEFVGSAQSGHQAAFLQPEDRAEAAAEENAFYSRKSD